MERKKHLSLRLVKILYLAGVFLVSLFFLSGLMNRGNTDMTMEMPDATYPTVTFRAEGMSYNRMYARTGEADITRLREHLTPVRADRQLSIRIDTYGTEVSALSFQVRSIIDGRLIEDTPIYDYTHNGDTINADFTLRDLIREGAEYSLCILLETARGEKLRYYTNLQRSDAADYVGKLEYVFYFDRTSYDKLRAGEELPVYLESSARGDNSTFAHVDIHSSLAQVTWGNLNVEPATEAVATIRELDGDTAVLELGYVAQIAGAQTVSYYFIDEYYRVRQGSERMYLLDYERTMEQIFDKESWTIANNKISLGITEAEAPLLESADGNYFAFVAAGRLYSYDVSGNRLADIFSFYDAADILDPRATRQDYEIRLFQVDETGNVHFLVCGEMNCGIHEGRCGLSVYYYDSTQNTVEEELFLPYDGDYEHLQAELSGIRYVNNAGSGYLAMGGDLIEVSLAARGTRRLAAAGEYARMMASDTSRCVAWSEGGDPYAATTLVYMDLEREQEQRIRAEEGQYLMPLGFFGEDLIYGEARQEDVSRDLSGHGFFPMERICIRGINGRLLKEYSAEGIYVLAAERVGDLIRLHRLRREEDGSYTAIADDQILNNDADSGQKNNIETAVTENYETLVQIALRAEIHVEAMQLLEPKQIIYEGERTAAIEREDAVREPYRLYERGRLAAEYAEAYEALEAAYAGSGVVRNAASQYLYRRRSVAARNQIMAITGRALGSEATPAELRTECIRELLAYAGSGSEVGATISARQDAISYLEEAMPGAQILDLGGLPLELALSFPAEEIPVLAELADGSAMLIIGYNELNVVVMDPSAEREPVYKLGKNDAERFFRQNGNRFITYRICTD